MISIGKIQKSSSQQLFEQLLTENGLEVPDGRMLFKYGINPVLREEIAAFLKPGGKGDEFVVQGNKYASALWVFLLASAWSEHYYDGSWSWELTLRQAGLEVVEGLESSYRHFAKLGLRQWGINFDEFRGEYQKAIVRHAGLPRKRILEGDGYLFKLVREVVLDNSDRDRLSEDLALQVIMLKAQILPLAFRKEAFLKSLADLCAVIHRSITIHQEADQAEAIRTLYPQFGKAEIDCLLRLQSSVLQEVRDTVRKKPFRLRFRRLIEVHGDQLYPAILIKAGKTCQHSSIIELLPEGRAVKNHYFIVAGSGAERQIIAELRRVDAEMWDLRQRSERLPAAWFCGDIRVSIERDGAEVAVLESCSVSAPDLSSTLVWSLYDHSEDTGVTRFELESGCPQAIDTAEFVLGLPDSAEWQLHALGPQKNAGQSNESDPPTVTQLENGSFLTRHRFARFNQCLVEVIKDNNHSSFHFPAADRQERFRFVGRNLAISEKDSVSVGVPRLYRVCDDGSLQRIESHQSHGVEVSWTSLGLSPVHLKGNEDRIHGPGHLEVSRVVRLPVSVDGKNTVRSRLLRQHFTIIPQNATVKKTMVEGQPTIYLLNWPLTKVVFCPTGDRNLHGFDRCVISPADGARMVFGQPQVPGGHCTFELQWANGSSSRMTFPSPHESCEISIGNASARPTGGQETVRVDLEELVYTQVFIRTAETNDSLRLVVQALDQVDRIEQNLWKFRHAELIRKDSFNIQLRFDSITDLVRQQFLLCRGVNPKVVIEVQSVVQAQTWASRNTLIRIEVVKSRVEAIVDWFEGILSFRVTRGEGSSPAGTSASCRVLALNLANPRELPTEIGTVSTRNATSIGNLLDPAGVWFIYPAENSETGFTPAIYPGAATRNVNLADFTEDLLQRAILTPDASRRASLMDDYLLDLESRIRGRDPRNLGPWKTLTGLCEQLGHIESAFFDLFNALARRPALLALLLALEKDRLGRFESNSQRSLKVNWMLLGLDDWLLVTECISEALKSDLAKTPLSKTVTKSVLQLEQERLCSLFWNYPFGNNFFVRMLVEMVFDIHFFPGELLGSNARTMLDRLWREPYLYRLILAGDQFHYVEEISAEKSDLSEKDELEKACKTMPCVTKSGLQLTTLADLNAQLACPSLFDTEAKDLTKSPDHRLFFRRLASQSMLTDQRTWRRWIEENFGLIQYSIQRHPADVVAIMDECLLIQLSLYYNKTKDKGIKS